VVEAGWLTWRSSSGCELDWMEDEEGEAG
jgi:hypothetical protein